MPTATADTATNTAEDTAAASAAAAAAALAQQTQRRLAFLVSFSAGGSAGVVTKTCVQPLERVKNILQIQGASTASGGSGSSMHRATGGGKYNGILDTLRTVVADEGGLALWKGNTANCARIVPAYAVRFATNDSIQLAIAGEGRTVRDLRASELVLAGTLAGVVQQVICYPFETVKARMALAYQTGQNYTSMGPYRLIVVHDHTLGGDPKAELNRHIVRVLELIWVERGHACAPRVDVRTRSRGLTRANGSKPLRTVQNANTSGRSPLPQHPPAALVRRTPRFPLGRRV